MAIRLVAMDLDDTLLRDDWTISSRTVKAIQAAREQGVNLTIATGRMTISAKPYAEQLGVDVPVITYHGALISQALSGEIFFRKVIPSALAAELLNRIEQQGLYAQVYLRDRVMVQKVTEWTQEYERIASVNIEEADLAAVLAAEPEGVEKILIIDEEARLDAFAPVLRESFGRDIHVTKSKPFFLELINAEVNKGVALAALARKFGVKQEEVMAVGDSLNDVEMITYAGLGVAMGNARPEVRKIADVITGTNEEDGVAQAIERYVLK
ncbi:Cof-type HAD-IIB family hydrolase [Paradesulfitobacterium ferrireducens]|uniref:Cof-type HAD-IIB family hydrolase n=1 Tax=Paradesulfitobacterium ferrireducens TaxID=2816476 RepID=UPI001A905E9A|nr:Cof-type HAD-IIB family hydrolase [Paradesulfitobacterium ferrireducens]